MTLNLGNHSFEVNGFGLVYGKPGFAIAFPWPVVAGITMIVGVSFLWIAGMLR